MSVPAAIVLGILIGWLIEWIIDWVYWRRKTPVTARTAAIVASRTMEHDALLAENAELKGRLGEYTGLSDHLGEHDALVEENARLKSELGKYTRVPDDLKVINGIGPEIERRLNQAGITTFAQLSELTPADLENILGDIIKRLSNEQSLLDQARDLAARNR